MVQLIWQAVHPLIAVIIIMTITKELILMATWMFLFLMRLTSADNLMISLTGPGTVATVHIFHYACLIIMDHVRIQLWAVIGLYYLQVIRNVMLVLHQNILLYGLTEI